MQIKNFTTRKKILLLFYIVYKFIIWAVFKYAVFKKIVRIRKETVLFIQRLIDK